MPNAEGQRRADLILTLQQTEPFPSFPCLGYSGHILFLAIGSVQRVRLVNSNKHKPTFRSHNTHGHVPDKNTRAIIPYTPLIRRRVRTLPSVRRTVTQQREYNVAIHWLRVIKLTSSDADARSYPVVMHASNLFWVIQSEVPWRRILSCTGGQHTYPPAAFPVHVLHVYV